VAQLVEYVAAMGSNASLLRTDAFCLVAASAVAFLLDAVGVPVLGIGFVDAHELALIAGVLLWSAAPRTCWHLAAAAVHAFFAAANVFHWQAFVAADIVAVGFLTTAAHVVFAALGCAAARGLAASGSLAGEPEAA